MDCALLSKGVKKEFFSRNDIFLAAKELEPNFKETQLRFYIGRLYEEGLISKVGHNLYTHGQVERDVYSPIESEAVKSIASMMKAEFPLVSFRIWNLSCLNEFLGHLVAHDHVFLEVERDGLEFVFERIHDDSSKKVLLNPSQKEIDLYSSDGDILIFPLKTESPAGNTNEYEISLEKLVVDMFSSRIIQGFISQGDYPHAFEAMFSKYKVNLSRLFRYARRRNKADMLYSFLKEKTNVELYVGAEP